MAAQPDRRVFRRAKRQSRRRSGDPDTSEEFGEIEPPGRDELLDVAIELANEIESEGVPSENGDIGWMVLHYSPAAERYTLQPMENDLYNGRAGVGLFFAALEKIPAGVAIPGLGARRPDAGPALDQDAPPTRN